MALRLEDKYVVHAKELGKGAWSVVRPCDVIPPYQPAALCAQPLAFGDGGAEAAGPSPTKDGVEPSSPVATAEVRLVAKVISKAHVQELAGGNPDRARADVMREVDTLRVLPSHPNVARFIEHLEDSESYYIIFEAAPGGDLCDLILAAPDSRIGEAQAKQFTAEILRAVLHCHRHGTAHRDIKPENLLIGHGNVLKLTDFGLAKVLKPPAVPPTPDGKPATASAAPNAASSSVMASPTTQSERQQFDFLAAAATADPVLAAMYPARLWSEGEATSRPGCTLPASATGVGASASSGSSAAARPVSAPALAPFCPGHEIVGTLRYGAPEMFQAKFERGTFDAFQADAWSVGVVAYIMLTGNFPFSAGSNATERETYKVLVDTTVSPPSFLSAAAQDFLLRLLTKNPEKRMTLADALDHRWIRETVQKNDAAARNALHLRGRSTEPTAEAPGDAAPLTAPPPVPLPPAMMRLRALVDDAARQLPSAEAAQILRAAFDDSVDAFGSVAHATARLREQLMAKPAAASSSGTAGSSSSRVASGSAAGSARRVGAASASPAGTRGASGSRPATPSSASAVRRPPSPAVRRPLGTPTSSSARATTPTGRPATPTARVPSPGRVGSATGSTTSTTGPRTLTPTRRAPGLTPTSATASGIRRAPVATTTGTAARRAESPTTAPKVATSTSSRTSSASRPVGGASSATATATSGTAAASRVGIRNASPLARASPVARRGTPLRTAGGATTPTAASSTIARRAAPAPPGTSASATSSARGAASASAVGTTTSSSSAVVLPEVGATAGYKGSKAIVRFVGETGFAAGKWVGLEMVEGREGIHDGTSAVDKRRYFSCPQGRGIFVRPSQVAAAAASA